MESSFVLVVLIDSPVMGVREAMKSSVMMVLCIELVVIERSSAKASVRESDLEDRM